MPLKGVRYRTVQRGGDTVRLAFRGPVGRSHVVEAKNMRTGATHTPAEFARDRARRNAGARVPSASARVTSSPPRPSGLSRLVRDTDMDKG